MNAALAAETQRRTSKPRIGRGCACGGIIGPEGKCVACRAKRLQRGAARQGPAGVPPLVHDVLRSPGRPLNVPVRGEMEHRFGHDFGHVRIHADERAAASAASVNARAYTVGLNVVFARGEFAPRTRAGRQLLAHELAHTVQQRAATIPTRLAFAHAGAELEARTAAPTVAPGPVGARLSPQSTASVAKQDQGDAGAAPAAPATSSASAGARDEPVDTPDVRQTLCVIRMGGCASTRSGGLPTAGSIATDNTTCRRETGYSGPDIWPTETQCRNPPRLPSAALVFARSLSRLYPGWLRVLPNCPCTDAEARVSADWSGPNACQPPYHIGAATGYRSARGYSSVPGTNHGQQCCYDPAGRLITEGAGAGTPDIVQAPSGAGAATWGTLPSTSTPGLGAVIAHYYSDVRPFNELGWEVYNRYWVPNNGNNCPANRKP